MGDKPKISMYWAASCGGCEISLVNIHEKILEVDAAFDLVFCPCLVDAKKKDVEAMADGDIAMAFVNGAVRTSENEEMVRLLRRKSKRLVAYGSCAAFGGIPALSNFYDKDDHFRTIYAEGISTSNPSDVYPAEAAAVPEGTLRLPAFYGSVRTVDRVVEVDCFIPGCPPEPRLVWNVLEAAIRGDALPPKGAVMGGGRSTVCDECERKKEEKKIAGFRRIHEFLPDAERCLLEQGLVCAGIATRDGCGGLCPKVGIPCAGCYGPPEGVPDQGAKMVAALGSILDIGPLKGMSEEEMGGKIRDTLAGNPDFAGTFYMFCLGASALGGRKR
jgi:F420-non-reducing hydrogenase small subunit